MTLKKLKLAEPLIWYCNLYKIQIKVPAFVKVVTIGMIFLREG